MQATDGKVTSSTQERLRNEAELAVDASRQARLLAELGRLEEESGNLKDAVERYNDALMADPELLEPRYALLRISARATDKTLLGGLDVDAVLLALADAAPDAAVTARAHLERALRADAAGDSAAAERALEDASATLERDPKAEVELALVPLLRQRIAERIEDGTSHEQHESALLSRIEATDHNAARALLWLAAARLANARGDSATARERVLTSIALGGTTTALGARELERLATATANATQASGTDDSSWRESIREAHQVNLELTDPAQAAEPATRLARMIWASALQDDEALALGELEQAYALAHAHSLDSATQLAILRLALGVTRESGAERIESLIDRATAIVQPKDHDSAQSEDPDAPTENLSRGLFDIRLLAPFWLRGVLGSIADIEQGRDCRSLTELATHFPRSAVTRAFALTAARANGALAAETATFAEMLTEPESRAAFRIAAAFLTLLEAPALAPAPLADATRLVANAKLSADTERNILQALALGTRDLEAWARAAHRNAETVNTDAANPRQVDALSDAECTILLRNALEAEDKTHARILTLALQTRETTRLAGAILTAFGADLSFSAVEREAALAVLEQHSDDVACARTFGFARAFSRLARGDLAAARESFETLFEADSSDLLGAMVTSELICKSGDVPKAALVLRTAADATGDPRVAAGLQLESGYLAFRSGAREEAVAAFEQAMQGGLEQARAPLTWARAAAAMANVGSYRAWLDTVSDGSSAHEVALLLEAVALDILGGDADGALAGLAQVEDRARGDLAIAAAILRLGWDRAAENDARTERALAQLNDAGSAVHPLIHAERYRLAKDRGLAESVQSASEWASAGGGIGAGIAWLASSIEADDPQAESKALTFLSHELHAPDLAAQAALVTLVADGTDATTALEGADGPGESPSRAQRLASLERALRTLDGAARAKALSEVGDAVDGVAEVHACALAGYAALAAGNVELALELFYFVTSEDAKHMPAWEGLRTAAARLGRTDLQAEAAMRVGEHIHDPKRAAAMLEQSGDLFATLGEPALASAEAAWQRSFERFPQSKRAFDKLFRMVRDGKRHEDVLALADARLRVTSDLTEITRLHWERARALRGLGDEDAAFAALDEVRELEPRHVGALALSGEILIRRREYESAAELLATLALVASAPARNRVTAGVTAVDLYENKLQDYPKALEVLQALHAEGLSTLPVRERLARAAARTGSYEPAARMLEGLMRERTTEQGQLEAARLALAIRRDKLADLAGALVAAERILAADAGDADALDVVLAQKSPSANQTRLLNAGAGALIQSLTTAGQSEYVQTAGGLAYRLHRVAELLQRQALSTIALSVAASLGVAQAGREQGPRRAKLPRVPGMALTSADFSLLLAPGDEGHFAELFQALGPTLAEALGPNLQSLGVTKKDRVDARAGLALRADVAALAGSLGIGEFELYVGGKEPLGVEAVVGEVPQIVLGPEVRAPFSDDVRARLSRELFGLVRGTALFRHHDDSTLASVVVAACQLAKVPVESPAYAVLGEVQRCVNKAISRKTRTLLPQLCAPFGRGTPPSPKAFVGRALASSARASVVFSASVDRAIADLAGSVTAATGDEMAQRLRDDARAMELLRFALSAEYERLRMALTLEAAR